MKDRLDKQIHLRGLARSRTHAQTLISESKVTVNGLLVSSDDYNFKVSEDDEIIVTDTDQYVSRGAYKLLGAIDYVNSNIDANFINNSLVDKLCLDVGSSTGGFTQVLLEAGAGLVTSIDVGTDQFSSAILEKYTDRIKLFEKTDIRDFLIDTNSKGFDLIVGDVSFISLDKILTNLFDLLASGGVLLFLLKPQFEVGKGNTHKGIVKDLSLIDGVKSKYKDLLSTLGFKSISIFDSSIKGGDGNSELFIYAVK